MPRDDWESLVKAQNGKWPEKDGWLFTPYGAFKLKKPTVNDDKEKIGIV